MMKNFKTKNLLLDLLKINSESGNEKELGLYIVKWLKERNFRIKLQKVNKDTGNFNIFAYVGEPKIIFNCHLDTVAKQLDIIQEEGFVYGRGACDTKSQIAASLMAGEKAKSKGLNNFGFLFTVQEETDFAGAKKALYLIPSSVKLIVVGEPTNLNLVDKQNGLIGLAISVKGKAAHGAVPEKGINAIEILMENLLKIKSIKFSNNAKLGRNVINIGKISGGTASNIVPDYAEASISIRNTIDAKQIISLIKKELKECSIRIKVAYNPVISDIGGVLENIKRISVPYFTEAYFFNKKAKTIIIGAGEHEDAHTAFEKVRVKDLLKLVDIYYQLIEEFTYK